MADAHHPKFGKVIDFLARIAAMDAKHTPSHGFGLGEQGGEWWVKFSIAIGRDLA